ncbi:MAG TPA: hypothetical protein VK826_20605 [Bacteroidia bacterium]|nr:hypothetical protein [Bacteroidia bacterium]
MVFSIAVPACLLLGLCWIGYKRSKRWIMMAGILSSALIFGFLQVCAVQVYIFSKQEGVQAFRMLGSHTWELENGRKITAEFQEIVKVVIINNSSRELALEEIIYSPSGSRPKGNFKLPDPEGDVLYIKPFSSESISLPQNKIDYFFDEDIPEEIEEYGSGRKSKYWLHE